MPDTTPTPAVWSDGDPLMEATAAAVWEQCRTENSIVVDDPRTIAAVAATVARQLLGTSTGERRPTLIEQFEAAHPEAMAAARAEVRAEAGERTPRRRPAPPAPVDRADLPARLQAVLTERYTALGNPGSAMRIQEKGPDGWPAEFPVGPNRVAEVLRELLADEQPPVPTDRAEPSPAELIRDRVNDRLKDCVWLTVDDEPMALAESWPDARSLIDAIHTAAGLDGTEPAPADRAATLNKVVSRLAAHAVGFQDVLDESDRGPWGKTIGADIADQTEHAGAAARRFARRLHAVEQLCSGRPGYHTITVKALLTAMSEADDVTPAVPAAPEETR